MLSNRCTKTPIPSFTSVIIHRSPKKRYQSWPSTSSIESLLISAKVQHMEWFAPKDRDLIANHGGSLRVTASQHTRRVGVGYHDDHEAFDLKHTSRSAHLSHGNISSTVVGSDPFSFHVT